MKVNLILIGALAIGLGGSAAAGGQLEKPLWWSEDLSRNGNYLPPYSGNRQRYLRDRYERDPRLRDYDYPKRFGRYYDEVGPRCWLTPDIAYRCR